MHGGYIVAGYANSNDGNVSSNHGGYDLWIIKLEFDTGFMDSYEGLLRSQFGLMGSFANLTYGKR